MKMDELGSDGKTVSTEVVLPYEWEYAMPEPTNVPEGKEFVCWRTRGGFDCYVARQVVKASNRSFYAGI